MCNRSVVWRRAVVAPKKSARQYLCNYRVHRTRATTTTTTTRAPVTLTGSVLRPDVCQLARCQTISSKMPTYLSLDYSNDRMQLHLGKFHYFFHFVFLFLFFQKKKNHCPTIVLHCYMMNWQNMYHWFIRH